MNKHINKNKPIKKNDLISRHFLGKVEGKLTAFEKKHLRSYLKGYTFFSYGYEIVNGVKTPKYHLVQQEYKIKE